MTLLLSALLAPGIAHATSVQLCVEANVAFNDHVGLPVGVPHDFFPDDGPEPARGIEVLIEQSDPSDPTLLVNTAVTGSDPGCVDVWIDSPLYRATVFSRVEVGGNEVSVLNSTTENTWAFQFPNTSASAGDQVLSLPVSRKWNLAALAGHALWRSDMGRTSAVVEFHTADLNGTLTSPCGGPCIQTRTEASGQLVTEVYIETPRAFLKMASAYSLGRALANDMGLPTLDLTADETHCKGRGDLSLLSIERPGAAVVEGFAHFYAAQTFNRILANATCEYPYWKAVNWDRLETCHKKNESPEGHVLDCADGPKPAPLFEIVPERDHKGYCDQRSPGYDLQAAQPDDLVALDVTRLFADLVVNTPLTRTEVGVALADSLPWVGVPVVDRLEAEPVNQGVPAATAASELVEHGLE